MEGFKDRRYFNALFKQAPFGCAFINTDGTISEANEQLSKMLGYAAGELRGKSFTVITHPQDLDADKSEFDLLTAGEIDSYRMEKRYITKQGKAFWATLWVYAIHESETVKRIIGFVQPLPNGGQFKIDKTGEKVIVRPDFQIMNFVRDNPKISVFGFMVVSYLIVNALVNNDKLISAIAKILGN